ncbi:hypothetical protein [Micromonospora sp. WMMD737]|uniref:hypothetical protein n=1 Tax=Micromonospora sp. WMMD737 TaxID=3404113 RepID=UPI003B94A6D2
MKPPRTKTPRQPLPWATWRRIASAHPSLLSEGPGTESRRRPDVDRADLLWLAGTIWLGLGIAHNELILTVGAIVAFLVGFRRP